MRSSAGVGITPPKVLVTPNPESSVIMSRTLGAPFFGATRGGQYGVDLSADFSIFPPNFGLGGGSCFPSTTLVAAGEPGGTESSPLAGDLPSWAVTQGCVATP